MAYVGIKEAAERLGVSQDTIRRRIKAGEIPAQQEPMGSGYRWLVEVPDDPETDTRARDMRSNAEGQASADALELAALRERVEGLERLVDELAADRDHWREQAHRSQVMAETAQRLAERAQALALPAGEPETEHSGTNAPVGPQPPSAARESLRERLRRLFVG